MFQHADVVRRRFSARSVAVYEFLSAVCHTAGECNWAAAAADTAEQDEALALDQWFHSLLCVENV